MSATSLAIVGAAALSSVPAGLRWLRVAQREHYELRSCGRFALRWWWGSTRGANRAAALAALAATGASALWPPSVLVTAAGVAAGPFGLGVRGRTKALDWTRRLRGLAAIWAAEEAAAFALAGWVSTQAPGAGAFLAAATALATPLLVDSALAISAPLESRAASKWVAQAEAKLRSVAPQVVGVTGSYGKTTTKGYIAHLCSRRYSVLASPASFNNALGLARTVNEHLSAGTELLVAEMGAYRRGEIAALCGWMRPKVGIVTALGPVHLERFGSEEATAQAKGELPGTAEVAVIAQSHPALVAMADRLEREGKRVWRCSAKADEPAAVSVIRSGATLSLEAHPPPGAAGHGEVFKAEVDFAGGAPSNVACALAAALELGVDWEEAVSLIPTLPTAPHRLERQKGASGAVVLDDTYNSNPAGARLALATLGEAASAWGRRVVVTPGMVELGPRQAEENTAFAHDAAAVASHLVIVGLTNRKALLAGVAQAAEEGRVAEVVLVKDRPTAVEWVRSNLGEGDAVLYENDLPDHFP